MPPHYAYVAWYATSTCCSGFALTICVLQIAPWHLLWFRVGVGRVEWSGVEWNGMERVVLTVCQLVVSLVSRPILHTMHTKLVSSLPAAIILQALPPRHPATPTCSSMGGLWPVCCKCYLWQSHNLSCCTVSTATQLRNSVLGLSFVAHKNAKQTTLCFVFLSSCILFTMAILQLSLIYEYFALQ